MAEVQRWVQTQPQLKNCRQDRNFILRFLRTNKYNIDKSCRMLERYLKMRTDHPKWFQNLDIEVTSRAANNQSVLTIMEKAYY